MWTITTTVRGVSECVTGTVIEVRVWAAAGLVRRCIDLDETYPVRCGDTVRWDPRDDRLTWDNEGMSVNVRRFGQPYEPVGG